MVLAKRCLHHQAYRLHAAQLTTDQKVEAVEGGCAHELDALDHFIAANTKWAEEEVSKRHRGDSYYEKLGCSASCRSSEVDGLVGRAQRYRRQELRSAAMFRLAEAEAGNCSAS
jgi:hypothetical protein